MTTFSKLTIDNINKFMLKIELIIKTIPIKKSPGTEIFTGDFYQLCNEEIISIFGGISEIKGQINTSQFIL